MFKIHICIERWKWNKHYEIYVSNLGNFKDRNKETIKPKVQNSGYLQIPLCNNKKGIIKYIPAHRIVMETWCPRADMWKAKLTVDHLNHNKRDNSIKNLEWVSLKENQRRAAADFLLDDKDALIQSLQDRIRNLEQDKVQKTIYTAVGIKRFNDLYEVRQFLIQRNPNYKQAKDSTIINAINKAYTNKTTYMGYHWKIG